VARKVRGGLRGGRNAGGDKNPVAICGQNPWRCGGKCLTLSAKRHVGAGLPHGLPVAAGRRPAALHRPAALGGSAPLGPRLAHELLRRHPPGAEADAYGAAHGAEAAGRRGAVQAVMHSKVLKLIWHFARLFVTLQQIWERLS